VFILKTKKEVFPNGSDISFSVIIKASQSREKFILKDIFLFLSIFILSGVKYQSFIFTAPNTSILHKDS